MYMLWYLTLIMLDKKISADHILKYFSYFSQKLGLEETVYMKCQSLFSGKNKKI